MHITQLTDTSFSMINIYVFTACIWLQTFWTGNAATNLTPNQCAQNHRLIMNPGKSKVVFHRTNLIDSLRKIVSDANDFPNPPPFLGHENQMCSSLEYCIEYSHPHNFPQAFKFGATPQYPLLLNIFYIFVHNTKLCLINGNIETEVDCHKTLTDFANSVNLILPFPEQIGRAHV